jgi:hypothetical protein
MINLKSLTKNVVAINLAPKFAKKAGMIQKNAQLLAATVVPVVIGFIADKVSDSKTTTTKKK